MNLDSRHSLLTIRIILRLDSALTLMASSRVIGRVHRC